MMPTIKPTIIDAMMACQEEKDSTVRLTIRYDSLESISDLSGVTRFQDGEPILGEFPFTFDDVLAKKDKLIAEYDAQEYARQRAVAYPEIGDQLDALYHAGVFPTDMAAKIKKVKDDNPKE